MTNENQKVPSKLNHQNLSFIYEKFNNYIILCDEQIQLKANKINSMWMNSTKGKIQLIALNLFLPLSIVFSIFGPLINPQDLTTSSPYTGTLGILTTLIVYWSMTILFFKNRELDTCRSSKKTWEFIKTSLLNYSVSIEKMDQSPYDEKQFSTISNQIKSYSQLAKVHNLHDSIFKPEEYVSRMMDFFQDISELWKEMQVADFEKLAHNKEFETKYRNFWRILTAQFGDNITSVYKDKRVYINPNVDLNVLKPIYFETNWQYLRT